MLSLFWVKCASQKQYLNENTEFETWNQYSPDLITSVTTPRNVFKDDPYNNVKIRGARDSLWYFRDVLIVVHHWWADKSRIMIITRTYLSTSHWSYQQYHMLCKQFIDYNVFSSCRRETIILLEWKLQMELSSCTTTI